MLKAEGLKGQERERNMGRVKTGIVEGEKGENGRGHRKGDRRNKVPHIDRCFESTTVWW